MLKNKDCKGGSAGYLQTVFFLEFVDPQKLLVWYKSVLPSDCHQANKICSTMGQWKYLFWIFFEGYWALTFPQSYIGDERTQPAGRQGTSKVDEKSDYVTLWVCHHADKIGSTMGHWK